MTQEQIEDAIDRLAGKNYRAFGFRKLARMLTDDEFTVTPTMVKRHRYALCKINPVFRLRLEQKLAELDAKPVGGTNHGSIGFIASCVARLEQQLAKVFADLEDLRAAQARDRAAYQAEIADLRASLSHRSFERTPLHVHAE